MGNGPLKGIKVVDFTQMMAGPWATQMLADLGAEVIKIERLHTGEWERSLDSMGDFLAGDSPFFHAMNRNKKSLSLDLKNPQAKEIIYKLVKEADVVAENFRPGVLDRLGYGYDKLSSINSRIVYLSSYGYGSSGPYVNRPGQDLLLQGMSGMLAHTGRRADPPTASGTSLVDEATAMMNALSIVAALYHQKCTGEGQKIEVRMLDTAIFMQCQEAVAHLNLDQTFERSENGIASPWLSAPVGVYPTKDGFMTIAMADIPTLGDIFDLPKFKDYNTTVDSFNKREYIKSALESKTIHKTTNEWLQILGEYDIWCGPVNSFDEVFRDPQVIHNDIVKMVDHPKGGELKTIGFPASFSKTPPVYHSSAPLVGQNNRELLRSLGYTDEDISTMEKDNIITKS